MQKESMLYDKYKQKMLKFKSALKAVVKHRILVICSALIVLSSATGLTVAKGAVFNSSKCPSQVVYGETLKYTAKAFLSDVYYEYSENGSKWTTTAPTLVGDYRVRACSKGAFGSVKTGKERKFSIIPKPIDVTIANSEVEYGSLPEVTASLAYKDTIGSVEYLFENVSLQGSNATPIKESITVLSASGKDVTNCYNIQVKGLRITNTQRKIALSVLDASKTYDGTALSSSAYEISEGSLAYQDEIDALFNCSIIDAGTIENLASFTFKSIDGVDVSSMYDVTVTTGYLTVEPRAISISTNTNSKVYDGKPLTDKGYAITQGEIVDGQRIAVESFTSQTEVGTAANNLFLSVVDGQKDVTSNYAISYTYGNLKVTHREITISTNDGFKIYDGLPLVEKGYTITKGELAKSQYAVIENVTSQTDAGTVENQLSFIIKDGGADVTHNYVIQYRYGSLVVSPRPITFESMSYEWTYDGTEHFHERFIANNVLSIHTVEVVTNTKVKDFTPEAVDNVLTYRILGDGQDVSHNYRVTQSIYGKLNIYKRGITLVPKDVTAVYDGTAHKATEIKLSPNTLFTLAEGHSFTASLLEGSDYQLIYAGEVNSFIDEDSVVIKDGDNLTVTQNYEISFEQGTVRVNPRTVKLAVEEVTGVYNGDAYFATNVIDVSDMENQGIVAGDVLSAYEVVGEGTDAGEYVSYIVEGSVVILSNGVDIVNCANPSYIVEYCTGRIIISKRDIIVRPKDVEKIYDGEKAVIDECEISPNSPYSLVKDHVIFSCEGECDRVDVGEGKSTVLSVVITTETLTEDVTHNYSVTSEDGKVTILPRPIAIKPVDIAKVYDGNPLFATEVELAADSPYGLVDGHSFEYEKSQVSVESIIDCGNIECSIDKTAVYIVSSSGGDISSNYSIDYRKGTLTVTQREIYIQPKDEVKVYDGTALTCNEPIICKDSPYTLVEGHTLSITTLGSLVNVGNVKNYIDSYAITDATGKPVDGNYIVTCRSGSLTVTPRPIKLKARSFSKEYDGVELTLPQYDIVEGSLAPGQDVRYITITGSITDVGSVTNDLDYDSVKIYHGENEVTSNYDLSVEDGTLTVTQRPIKIVTKSYTWKYDACPHSLVEYDGPDYNGTCDAALPAPSALVLDHSLKVVDYPTIIDAGSVSNVIKFKILDGNNQDKTANYDIKYTYGTLTIDKISIRIQADSAEWTYDGNIHSRQTFTYLDDERVLPIHMLVVKSKTTVRNATTGVDNVLTMDVVDSLGKSVGQNYNVTVVAGTLKVHKASLIIRTDDKSWTYDGTAHSYKSYTIESGSLGAGDELEIVSSATITDAGETDNVQTYAIKYKGTDIFLRNYDVTITFGKLRVDKRTVVLQPWGKELYTGELQSAKYLIAVSPTSIAAGHTATATMAESYIDVGVYSTNVASYDSVVIKDAQGQDVTKNYDFTCVEGSFEIVKNTLYVIADDATKEYDGTPLTKNSYTYMGLADGHEIYSVTITGSITEVGSIDNIASNVVVVSKADGTVKTGNYNVVYVEGTLTVKPIAISFTSVSDSKSYDGTPLINAGYEIVSGEILSGHLLQVVSSSSITKPGRTFNHVKFKVTDAGGVNDYTANYRFTNVQIGTLEVKPVKITVTTGSDSKYYDGTPLTCNVFEYEVEGGQDPTHDICITVTGTRTSPGTSQNTFEIVVTKGGIDITDGYEVTANLGTLTVYEKTYVELRPEDAIKVYDGTPLVATVLLGFEKLEALGYYYENLEFAGSQTEVGRSYSEIAWIEIYDQDGNPIDMAKFDIVLKQGQLDVTKEQVKIRLHTVSKVYDGKPISYYEDEFSVIDDKGLTLDIKLGGELTEVGKLTYDQIRDASTYVFYDENGNDVTDNYYLLIEGSPLEVKRRELVVTSMTATKEYDGTALASPYAWISTGMLVEGHTIEYVMSSSIIYVGAIENSIDQIIIRDSLGNVVTDCYSIQKIIGYLVVTPIED